MVTIEALQEGAKWFGFPHQDGMLRAFYETQSRWDSLWRLSKWAFTLLDSTPVDADWLREDWGFRIWDSESRTWFLKNTEVRWRDGITYLDTIPVGDILDRGHFTAFMFSIGRFPLGGR